MRIGMLGPLEVRAEDGSRVEVPGARLRTLLIMLALDPGRVVGTARLIDGIWADAPPAGAGNALQALVSRLRRAVPVPVESHPAGYRLVIEPDEVDVSRFERLVATARTADPATTAATLRAALALWRGPALLDVAEVDAFAAALTRLTELRLAATEDRVEADLRLGRGGELVTELTTLVAEHPLRERLAAALIRALCAAGRPAEALTVYDRTRRALADALGADPGPELAALHTAVLRGELTPVSDVDRAARTNLRAGLTSFVGRDEDVARVGKLVGEYRLTTLTGPGGAGKTRLAVETAGTLLDAAPDGVWLVELAPVTGAAGLPQAVLTALGLREQSLLGPGSAGEVADRLVAALRGRAVLLVLDNCEHLIEAVAALADRLLGACPRLRILATSREPIGITGEALWPVEPLALPPAGAGVAEATGFAAVRLLVDRAVAARPGFAVTEDTVGDVVRICRALDGMPLAVELAAARLRTMTLEQLAARLDDRFRLLTQGSRTAPPQHRTLRAVVDWSWELLGEDERALLRRLAVFSGGATVEAAERVCAGAPVVAEDVLDLLTALAEKSLLVADDTGPAPRYRMLETIKAYGLERLDEAGERERTRVAHATYFAELAVAAEAHLRRAEQLVWLERLAADHDNINAALRAALAAGDARRAVWLASAAGWYWWLTGHKQEGAELVRQALALPGEVEPELVALACAVGALFATTGVGDERAAEGLLTRARQLAGPETSRHPMLRFLEPMQRLLEGARSGAADVVQMMDPLLDDEDPWVAAQARLNRGRTLVNLGHPHAEARADIEASLAAFRAIGERWGTSYALTVLADLLAQDGDLTAALGYYDQAIVVLTEIGTSEDVLMMRARQAQLRWLLGDPVGSAAAIAEAELVAARTGWPDAHAVLAQARADLARWSGDLRTARVELDRAETTLRTLDVHPVFIAMVRDALGHIEAAEGDLAAAAAHRAEALDLAVTSIHAPTVALVLIGIADQALRQGDPAGAAQLLAASEAIRGGPDKSQPDARRVAAGVRDALGDSAFAFAGGIDDAVALAGRTLSSAG
ncbi:AfsR/SARP family transcriptional regulator [Actinophytocola sp.]|uniref:AfsR/SARP family transcriptional regulator n=1 Tax=Actinophytocola sp. TaxID=1872138 RepID=UPI002D80400A|nr:BTAD domain-containing putative transcriptional regulator [Actinophytocola sp.]HET9139354.1 BTAD domain-containing putative transcriptional regulator [Actinophytocola sp.]